MATFETVMYDDTMYERVADTEMVIDQNKMVQAGNDIDIDLDFENHGEPDEMMAEEEDLIGDYDLELEDATFNVEQDAEMTDESDNDKIIDEEISDAPVDRFLEETQAPEHEMVPVTVPTEMIEHIAPLGTVAATSDSHLLAASQLDLPSFSADAGSATNVASSAKAREEHPLKQAVEKDPLEKAVEEEPEELITWESDEEEEEKTHDEVGEVVDEAEPAETFQVIRPLEIIEPEAIYKTAIEENPDVLEEAVLLPQVLEHIDTVAKHQQPEEHVVEPDQSVSGDDTGRSTEPEIPVAAAIADEDEHDQDQAVSDQSEMDQLHPIVIRYLENEMSLFHPTIEEEHMVYFLREKTLAFGNCESLFQAFRTVLGHTLPEHDSLVLECPDLHLEIHEGVPECSTLSLNHLLRLYLDLSHNDGHENPSPFLIVLKHHQDISARLQNLYDLLHEGRGLSTLASSALGSGTTNPAANESAEANDDVHEEDDGTTQDQHDLHEGESSEDANDPGFATPSHNDQPETENDEFDFTSPNNVQKYGISTPDQIIEEHDVSGIYSNKIAASSAVQQPSVDDSQISEDITYNDDEEKEITYEEEEESGESNNPAQQSADTPDLLISDTNTNQMFNNTNNSTTSEETLKQEENVPLPPEEDDFDLDDTISQHLDTNEAAEPKDAAITGLANEDPTLKKPKDLFDDIDEIDYSDDDDEPTPSFPIKPNPEDVSVTKPRSPKRSIDDSEESPRGSKKLRPS